MDRSTFTEPEGCDFDCLHCDVFESRDGRQHCPIERPVRGVLARGALVGASLVTFVLPLALAVAGASVAPGYPAAECAGGVLGLVSGMAIAIGAARWTEHSAAARRRQNPP